MSRVNPNPQFGGNESVQTLQRSLASIAREHAIAINAVVSGSIDGTDMYSAMPTGGTWKKGDFVRNANPAEAGAAASKYIILGWVRLTSGTANVLNTDWFQVRTLTGN